MKVRIAGIEYLYVEDIIEEGMRKSFNDLVMETFEISFKNWYEKGYWKENYIPHLLVLDGEVVANVSVHITKFMIDDQIMKSIQIGTVMTKLSHRNRGLSKFLMNKVLEKYKDLDDIYLFANDDVLEFYPKFGFTRGKEFIYSVENINGKNKSVKLNMDIEKNREMLIEKYGYSNPYSRFSIVDNIGLLMFYCDGPLRDNIYYIEEFDTIAVVEFKDSLVYIYDIYSNEKYNIYEILERFAKYKDSKIILGFTPKSKIFNNEEYREEDLNLFILNGKSSFFSEDKLLFPKLSHG